MQKVTLKEVEEAEQNYIDNPTEWFDYYIRLKTNYLNQQ